MDPVLQRFGDVTIQRLEKPKETKVRPQSDGSSLEKFKEINEEVYSEPDNDSADEDFPEESPPEFAIPNLKRTLLPPQSQGSMKKFKFNSKGDITLEKKCDDLGQNNFSEPEISDYEEESEIEESDSELMNEPSIMEAPNDIKPPAEKETSEDEVSNSASFFEKLVEQVEIPAPPTPSSSSSQKHTEPIVEDDYDIDIKEKLKEMGEISFETVKKGEKPKKTEPVIENEVVVTPAKKFGKNCVYFYINIFCIKLSMK